MYSVLSLLTNCMYYVNWVDLCVPSWFSLVRSFSTPDRAIAAGMNLQLGPAVLTPGCCWVQGGVCSVAGDDSYPRKDIPGTALTALLCTHRWTKQCWTFNCCKYERMRVFNFDILTPFELAVADFGTSVGHWHRQYVLAVLIYWQSWFIDWPGQCVCQ